MDAAQELSQTVGVSRPVWPSAVPRFYYRRQAQAKATNSTGEPHSTSPDAGRASNRPEDRCTR